MNKTMKTLVLALLSFLVALPVSAAQLTAVDKRSLVPEFELQDLKGKSRTLSEFKGKVTVVSFWASWAVSP